MEIIRDGNGEILAIELTRVEMRELLAFEATCACLIARDSRSFLEDLMRGYGISEEDMRPFLDKQRFSREDVWRLQIFKRSSQGDYRAVHILGDLRRLEARLGEGVLQTYVDRRKILPTA